MNSYKMGLPTFPVGFFHFFIFSVALVNGLGLYFPTAEVNLTLPSWTVLTKPLPPLLRLRAIGGEKSRGDDVVYGVLSESTSGLFVVDGDVVRVNGESFTSEEIVSRQQSVVVRGRQRGGGGGGGESANATINLALAGDKINCGRAKRNLCFWDGALYRIAEDQPPTPLGELSSQFFGEICKNYSVSYEIFKGKDYVEVGREKKSNVWILSTKRRFKGGKSVKIGIGVKCTMTSPSGAEDFLKEFDLVVVGDDELRVSFQLVYEVPGSNVVAENERIARGLIGNPEGGKLKFSLGNDTEGFFELRCLPGGGEAPKSSYGCGTHRCCLPAVRQGEQTAALQQKVSLAEVTTKKSFHLTSPYTAYVLVEDAFHRLRSHNITLSPSDPGLEKLSLMLSTNPEESFLLGVKYPESVEVSRRALMGTRVAEPMVGSEVASADVRRRVVRANIRFEMLSVGVLNVTQTGGIVFVSGRNQLKEDIYNVKVSGTHPNGYRFISTMRIIVTDTPQGEHPCDKPLEENLRPSCSQKRFQSDCEKTCGVASGVLTRTSRGAPLTSACTWRSNHNPEKLSRLYQTCSPDLSTCPDRFCDPLETLFPKICPQDCTEYVFGSANKENHLPGIASATGACSCDNRQKCLCALLTKSDAEKRKPKEVLNDTDTPRQKETISAVKASYADQCGLLCLLSIVGGSVILILGTSAILLMMHRRRLRKRCPNQRPLKEDMVNINYEEYVERPGDILRPLTQGVALKETPEYFDKKWEFPRHRLTIEETIGEGEFGKVLKARADGIGGHDGSTTVAVKTLKDNAKESELADLISEYQLLKEIDHPNVIHLLGACTKLDGPLYIIIEYAKHGSLRNYLRKHRHLSWEQVGEKSGRGSGSGSGSVEVVTPKDILTFAWQIAKGMSYLTEMKLVHRDLAARNVLVAEGLICKISDFGLTRDIYEDDTYLKRSKGRVPVKWMALESLADHVYTTKSDVWSYGVVLWELVTTGASPYPGIAGQDLFHLLKSGYRMEKPSNCSSELYQILRSCWQESPSQRPTFKSLVAKLEEMLGEGKDYLDLNPRTAENKTYFSELLCSEDEKESLVVGEGEGEGKESEVFALEFKMFEKQCGVCGVGECGCGGVGVGVVVRPRYENEEVLGKPKYENEGMEDTGYVQPRGKPKPVGESNGWGRREEEEREGEEEEEESRKKERVG